MKNSITKAIAITLTATALSGCITLSPKKTVRGNLPPQSEIAKITVGSSKTDVLNTFGPPLSVGAFNDKTLVYMNRHTEAYAFFEPKITKYRLLALRLNDNGTVAEIVHRDIHDLRTPPTVTETTPSIAIAPNWLEEILGNIGRFRGQ